jgi:SAM-dependent methyltransferase
MNATVTVGLPSPGLSIDDPAYFDRLAEVEADHWWSRGMWRIASHWLERALRGRRGLHALDIGCGTGLGAVRLAELPGIARIVGLDPSPDALSYARTRHAFALVRGSALALPFRDGRFDVLTCFDVVQHLPPGSLLDAARELRRVLRPGGIALVRSNTSPDGEWDEPGRGGLGRLKSAFGASGFAVRRASYANCLPALAQELRGRLTAGRRGGHPSGGGLQIRMPHPWVNRLLEGVASVEAVVAGRLATPLPYGHSTLILAHAEGP